LLNNIKVALLYGGESTERDISIKSGKAVEEALKNLNIPYKVFDPVEKDSFIEKIRQFNPDVVFIALHGKGGEDGTIQGVLDFLGYRYTGSPMKASAVAMDKGLTKDILKGYGIRVPEGMTFFTVEEALSVNPDFPVVVKAANQGSSIGVYISKDKEEYRKHIHEAFSLDNKVIVEEFIEGREITVGILNGKPLDIIEIKVEKGFYDFENKYFTDKTRYICPAEIEEKIYKRIQETALRCYQIIGCKGAARVDFILKQDKEYFLEINTIPGLTDHSLLPKAALCKGITFEKLIEEILKDGLQKES